MQRRWPDRFVVGIGILFGVLSVAADPPCPDRVEIWEHEELIVEAGEWRGTVLELDVDRGRLREVAVRYAQPRLAEEEARWFQLLPLAVEAYWAGVSTRVLEGEELAELCRELEESGLGTLRDGVGNVCEDDGLVTRSVTLASASPGFRYGLQARAKPGFGLLCDGKPARRIRTELEQREVTLEPPQPATAEESAPPSEGSLLGLAVARLASLRDGLDLDTGPAAHAEAGRVLAELSRVAGQAELPDLSPIRLLDAAGAGDEALEAAILEALGRASFDEYPGRLKTLGDIAGSRSVYDLVQLVRVAFDRRWPGQPTVLALRALYRADASRARLEAIPFLGRPGREEVIAALGIFALTEPALADELDELELADAPAVRAACVRLLEHVVAADSGEDARRSAVRTLEQLRSRD